MHGKRIVVHFVEELFIISRNRYNSYALVCILKSINIENNNEIIDVYLSDNIAFEKHFYF